MRVLWYHGGAQHRLCTHGATHVCVGYTARAAAGVGELCVVRGRVLWCAGWVWRDFVWGGGAGTRGRLLWYHGGAQHRLRTHGATHVYVGYTGRAVAGVGELCGVRGRVLWCVGWVWRV